MKSKRHHSVTRVSRANGSKAQTYVEERQIFREHFCDAMSGSSSTFTELVLKHRLRLQNTSPVVLDAEVLPSKYGLVQKVREHQLLVEETAPLDCVIDIIRKSGRGD